MNNDSSLMQLFRDLVSDTRQLFRYELKLAQQEIADNVGKAQHRLVLILAGLLLGFCALLILLQAVVTGLATVMPAWLASLIVAVVVGIVGFVMVQRGQAGFEAEDLVPHRAAEQVKRDKDMIMEKVS